MLVHDGLGDEGGQGVDLAPGQGDGGELRELCHGDGLLGVLEGGVRRQFA